MRGTFFYMPMLRHGDNTMAPRPNSTPSRPDSFIPANSPNQYFSDMEQNWMGHYGDTYDMDMFSATYWPYMQQYAEWSQQMVSQMYQNHWNSAPEQMRRAMEAGINPYLAANGIAGNGSSSAQPAPPSAVGAGASSLQSVGSALGTLGSLASAGINGYAVLSKLKPEVAKITAETANIFESMGFTKLQSKALSIQLKYMDEKEQIGVWQALANLDRTKAEYENLVATHNNIVAQYDEIIAQKDLLIAERGEVEARKILDDAMSKKESAIAKWYDDENIFFEKHHFRSGSPVYESIRNMVVDGIDFDADAFGNTIGGYESKVQGAVEEARQSAIANHAYGIELGRQSGKNAADELYGRIGSPADLAGRIAKMGMDVINGGVQSAQNLFKSGDAKKIRAELRMVLDNLYDQLDKFPDDDSIKPRINEIQAALSLSNKELSEWYKKYNN